MWVIDFSGTEAKLANGWINRCGEKGRGDVTHPAERLEEGLQTQNES